MKHTHSVQNYLGNHRQLAEEIGDLYYDSLADCARHLQQAAEDIDRAWEICKPFVK